MTSDALDPLIHAPARLRIVVTLANLPGVDALGSLTHTYGVGGRRQGLLRIHRPGRKSQNGGSEQAWP